MSTPAKTVRGRRDGSRPRRALVVLVALVIGVAVVTIWLLRGANAPPPDAHRAAVVAAPADDGAARAGVHVPDDGRSNDAVAPASAPAPEVERLESVAAVDGQEREIRGVAVRASDESGVSLATVIALQNVAGRPPAEVATARTDGDGAFTLRVSHAIDAFRVLALDPGPPRLSTSPKRAVTVHATWTGGDPASGEVRLVLDTGTRLDVRVVDAAGAPLASVVASCAGRKATTDADGRFTLLDLKLAAESSLALQHNGIVTTFPVAPVPGRLRQELNFTLP